MFCPPFASAARTLFDVYGSYLLAQLKADEPLAAEALTFGERQDSLLRHIEVHETARRASFETLAARDRARIQLAEAIAAFSFCLRRITRHDFKAPLYLTYFPAGSGFMSSCAIETRIVKVEHILAKLASETHPALTVHTQPIRLALDGYRRAVEVRNSARLATTSAFVVLAQEKRRWIDGYRQIYAKLLLFHHDNPRLAETYFRKAGYRKQQDAEDDSEALEPQVRALHVPNTAAVPTYREAVDAQVPASALLSLEQRPLIQDPLQEERIGEGWNPRWDADPQPQRAV